MTTALETGRPGDATSAHDRLRLEAKLREVEPSLILVPAWLLQNIIALDRGFAVGAFTVPHRKSHLIDRQRLLRLVQDDNLPLSADLPDVPTVTLLARSESDWLENQRPARVLRQYWELLFHARLDAEFQRALSVSSCDLAAVQARIERLGRGAFNEARFVLQRERYLGHDADERETYREFAAVYLEFHHFRPDLLPVYFPAIQDPSAILSALSADVNSIQLLEQTRPAGADDGSAETELLVSADVRASHLPDLVAGRRRIERDARRGPQLLNKARRAASVGNDVGAAALRWRVYRTASHDNAIYNSAIEDLYRLVDRLVAALQLVPEAANGWRAILTVVLAHTARGWWNPEAKLLYDLQKVCVYHEKEIYSVGVVQWLLEFGGRPLCRPQPRQRLVLMCKSLRSALGRVSRVRLAPQQRRGLTQLLHEALEHVESRLRLSVRPVITKTLDAGGLHPTDAVEEIARQKLTEELIDGLAHRGFLTFGDLRDGIARNQIKFDDVSRSIRAFGGDPLLRIDRRLADSLDGVYHRAEIYLQFFQRSSSLFFGTRLGRLLTRTLLMPIGGSFLIMEALDHTLLLVIRKLTGLEWIRMSWLEEYHRVPLGRFLIDNVNVLILALILLGVLNWPAFRAVAGHACRLFGHALWSICIDIPRRLAQHPWVLSITRSRTARLLMRGLAKPLCVALFVVSLLPRTASPGTRWMVVSGVFGVANILFNIRAGRALEQAVIHWLRMLVNRLSVEVIADLFLRVSHFFRCRLEDFDRMVYAVDEWLRFRARQSNAAFIAKAAIGVPWFYFAYFTRFAVNLLVEPQINPLKHFPVVTVSHKLVLPQVKLVADGLQQLGLNAVRAGSMAATIVTAIPGIFGFLAWELRANWQLYRANSPPSLKPVPIGSHGETMRRLLHPGFHSGTVPRLFARLRHAQRHAHDTSRAEEAAHSTIHKQLEAAEHVREAVARFIERELISLLNQHPAWQNAPVLLTGVKLCCTRISIELFCHAVSTASAQLSFEQRDGWIMAGIDMPGWILHTSALQSQVLGAALFGLYRLAGVDMVKEQIERFVGELPVAFEVSAERLSVWIDGRLVEPRVFDLTGEDILPSPDGGRQILFRSLSLSRDQWRQIWTSPDGIKPDLVATFLPVASVKPGERA
ncbi:MAG: hypothetical protein ABSH20_11220 [Tepidisphaeraceae bacterium]